MIHNLVARHDIWRLAVDYGTFFFSKIMRDHERPREP